MTAAPLPEDQTVGVNGLRLHYLDWGNDAAQCLLLLHGTASHAHIWDTFAPSVSHAFHVIALDQRGYGDSEAPPDYRTGYLQEYWASDIKGVVDQLGLTRIVLLGLSTGGNNAMHFAARHPEYVERLVIVEMGPQVLRAGADRVIAQIPAQEEFDTEEAALEYLTSSAGRADPVLTRAHALHAVTPIGGGRVALKGDPSLRRRDWRRPLSTPEENWAAAHKVACPTLLIRGGDSRLLAPGIAEQMEREMSDCKLVTIPGAGHNVPLHKPVEFEAAVRTWLGV